MSAYVVRQIMPPLRMPMRLSETEGGLLQAVPRANFTVFDTVDAATRAIGETIQRRGEAQFDVVTVAQHEQDQARVTRTKRTA